MAFALHDVGGGDHKHFEGSLCLPRGELINASLLSHLGDDLRLS